MENGQKSAEWEAQVFNRSRTREEYVKLVATLIWKLRDYNKKVYFNFNLGHIMKTQISENKPPTKKSGFSKSHFHIINMISGRPSWASKDGLITVKNRNLGFRMQTQKKKSQLCKQKN